MPYPGEHAARIKDPAGFDRFRRENDKFGTGIDVIWGITTDGTTEAQSIRFNADKFTPEEAKKWCADHDYEILEFEEAAPSNLIRLAKNSKPITVRNQDGDSAEILLYDVIGTDPWSGEGTSAKAFAETMNGFKSKKSVTIRMNCPGGYVHEGLAMYNTLINHPAKINVIIDGIVASMATVVAMAGDSVTMAKNGLFMIHNPWGFCMGDADAMRLEASIMEKMKESIIIGYQRKSTLSAQALSDAMDAETWLNADGAKAAGFVDEISGEMKIAASIDMEKFGYRKMPKALSEKSEEKPANSEDFKITLANYRRRLELAEAEWGVRAVAPSVSGGGSGA